MNPRKFVCQICDHVYDEAAGEPVAGLAPGTRWEDIPAVTLAVQAAGL